MPEEDVVYRGSLDSSFFVDFEKAVTNFRKHSEIPSNTVGVEVDSNSASVDSYISITDTDSSFSDSSSTNKSSIDSSASGTGSHSDCCKFHP